MSSIASGQRSAEGGELNGRSGERTLTLHREQKGSNIICVMWHVVQERMYMHLHSTWLGTWGNGLKTSNRRFQKRHELQEEPTGRASHLGTSR